MRTILGIDPGLRNAGWGVISVDGNSLKYIASGTIKTDNKNSLCKRLATLSEELKDKIPLKKVKS